MRLWQLRTPLHQSWHFTAFCLSIVLGLGLSVLPFASIFANQMWLVTAIVIFGFVLWKRWRWLVAITIIAGCLFGLSRGSVDIEQRAIYKQYFGKMVRLEGDLSEDVDIGKKGETVLRLSNIAHNGQKLPAEIWVTTRVKADVMRGDRITVAGKVSSGFGSFAASIYSANIEHIGRHGRGDVAVRSRDDFGEKVRAAIDEPAASLGMGFLTGQRRSLPTELDLALLTAGLTHIVVASGYNLTILVRFIKRLFDKKSRYLTVLLSIMLVTGFMFITGLSPSMVRAGLIATMSLIAWYFGRSFHPATLLCFAAAATGLWNPSYVWGNLGWQLSFAAFAGVMILSPLLQAYFFGNQKPHWLRQLAGETIAAQIATAPLLLFAFGQISNVAIIANLAVLPLVPLAMLLTFLTGLTSYLVPFLAEIIAMPTQLLLDYMVWVTKQTAGLDWAISAWPLPFAGLVVAYVIVIAFCWWMQHASKYSLRQSSIID